MRVQLEESMNNEMTLKLQLEQSGSPVSCICNPTPCVCQQPTQSFYTEFTIEVNLIDMH